MFLLVLCSFYKGCLVRLLSYCWVPSIFWILIIRCLVCKHLLLSEDCYCPLAFFTRLSLFQKLGTINSVFICCWFLSFWSQIHRSSPAPLLYHIPPILSSSSSAVLGCTLQCSVLPELILPCNVRWGSSFIPLQVDILFSQHPLVSKWFFSQCEFGTVIRSQFTVTVWVCTEQIVTPPDNTSAGGQHLVKFSFLWWNEFHWGLDFPNSTSFSGF